MLGGVDSILGLYIKINNSVRFLFLPHQKLIFFSYFQSFKLNAQCRVTLQQCGFILLTLSYSFPVVVSDKILKSLFPPGGFLPEIPKEYKWGIHHGGIFENKLEVVASVHGKQLCFV